MKRHYFYPALAFAAMVLAGCGSDDNDGMENRPEVLPDGRVAVRFSAGGDGIEVVEGTRASSSWNSGFDKNIGISAYSEDGSIYNGYSNVQYRSRHSNADGWSFYPYGDGIYYSADEHEKIKFSAYYPYQSLTGGNIYKVDLTNQQDIDELLWTGKTADSYNKNSSTVNLNFMRQYALVRILLEGGAGYDENESKKNAIVTISDMALKADFNVETGECVTTETGMMTFADKGVSAGWYVSVLPTYAKESRVVTVTLASGEAYTWEIGEKEFKAGHYYEYHLRFNKKAGNFYFTVEDRVDGEEMGPYEYIDLGK